MLFTLEISIVSNNLLNYILVWGRNMMVLQQMLITLVNWSPTRNLFVESKIAKYYCGCTRNTRATMNKHFIVFAVHKIIQVLGSSKCFLNMLILIVIINWVVNSRLNTFVLVKLLHFRPWVASFSNIFLSLKVQNRSNSNIFHIFHILIINWIRTNVNSLVFHLVDVEILKEIGVSFLNTAINNPIVASQVSLVSCSISNDRVCLKLALVLFLIRMVDIDYSLGVSFSFIWSSWSFTGMKSVAILNS